MAGIPAKRTEKLQLMLDDDELAAIDDWRFENRLPTRAAAMRELIRLGLTAHVGETYAERRTADFRIVAPDA
ncbi:MAG: hypothetical protein ACMVY4_17675 [Minwuia sp.]|uniref:hypothetical protein n=1 Tax=Minwuia sp. TaxID=2493630 RepID=UPI003A89E22B